MHFIRIINSLYANVHQQVIYSILSIPQGSVNSLYSLLNTSLSLEGNKLQSKTLHFTPVYNSTDTFRGSHPQFILTEERRLHELAPVMSVVSHSRGRAKTKVTVRFAIAVTKPFVIEK